MPVQTIYLLGTVGVTPNYWGNTQLNGTAPAASNSAFGWLPAKTAISTPFRRARIGATAVGGDAAVASTTISGQAPRPGTGTGATTASDSFVAGPFTGTFSTGNWVCNFALRATTAGAVGRIRVAIQRSANANGSGNSYLTGAQSASIVTLSTTADVISTFTLSGASQVTLNSEYLFFQVEWEETTQGTSNSNNVLFRIGTSSITTPNYVPAPLTASVRIDGRGQVDLPADRPVEAVHLTTATQKAGPTTMVITVPAGGVPAGSTIVIHAASLDPSIPISTTDSAGNVYIRAVDDYSYLTLNGSKVYCTNCLALTDGQTITINSSGAPTFAVSVLYITGGTRVSTSPPYNYPATATEHTVIDPFRIFNSTARNSLGLGVGFVNSDVADGFTQDPANGWRSPPIVRVGTTGGVATTNVVVYGAWQTSLAPIFTSYRPILGVAANSMLAMEEWWGATPGLFTLRLAAKSTIAGVGSVSVDATVVVKPLPVDHVAAATVGGQSGRTNLIRNPRAEGAVPGTPGTAPTYWTDWGSQVGLTQTIVGTGTEDDIPYIDIRFAGTTAAGAMDCQYEPTGTAGIPVGPTQSFVLSVYYRLVGGSLTNVNTMGGGYKYYSAAGGADVGSGNTNFTITSAPLRTQRYSNFITVSSITRFLSPHFSVFFSIGVAVDFTIRLGAPQLELGGAPTDVILPPVGVPGVSERAIQIRERVRAIASPLPIGGEGSVAANAVFPPQILTASTTVGGIGGKQNFVRNPRAEGAIPGTPGTLPTNWSTGSLPAGVTQQVVGTGTDAETGFSYVDIRYFGTTAGTGNFYTFIDPGAVPAGPGHTFITSAWLALVGGSQTNLSQIYFITNMTQNALITGVSATLTSTLKLFGTQGTAAAGTTPGGLVAFTQYAYVAGPIDFTIRIAACQLERGLVRTPMILPLPGTTNTYPTRAIDVRAAVRAPVSTVIGGQGGKTNYLRNPRGEGAIAGSPGTAPTYWDIGYDPGMQQQVVGRFVVDGIDVVRVRWWGIPTNPDVTWAIADALFEYPQPFLTGLSEGRTVARSLYIRTVAGTWAGTQRLNLWGQFHDAVGTNLSLDSRTPQTPPGSTFVRWSDTVTLTGGVAPYSIEAFGFIFDGVDPRQMVDVTIDIGGGQLEIGEQATPLILPPAGTTVAWTREIEIHEHVQAVTSVTIGGVGAVTCNAVVKTSPYAGTTIGGQGGKTNWIFNPRAEGAIAGTPGTWPTGWQPPTRTSGLTQTILGTGTENGIPYIDIRWSGTTNDIVIDVVFSGNQEIPAYRNQYWALSAYIKLTAGSASGITLNLNPQQLDANGGYLRELYNIVTPASAATPLNQARVSSVSMMDDTRGVAFVRPVMLLRFASGLAVDITLRFGAIQAEHVSVSGLILPPIGIPGVTSRAIEIRENVRAVTTTALGGTGGRTNYVRNPRAEGAIPGTPGTYPTYWTGLASPDPISGLSTTIVGTGYEDDIPYIDVRVFGTTPASHPGYTSSILFEQDNWVTPVGHVQGWAFSLYAKRISGSSVNFAGFNHGYIFLDEAGTEQGRTDYIENVPTTASLRTQRFFVEETVWYSTTRRIVPYWRLDFLNPNTVYSVDLTLRIGGVQLERGSETSGLILPPVGAPAVTARGIEVRDILRAVAGAAVNGLGSVGVDATKVAGAGAPAPTTYFPVRGAFVPALLANDSELEFPLRGVIVSSSGTPQPTSHTASIRINGLANVAANAALPPAAYPTSVTMAGVGGRTNVIRNPRAEGAIAGTPGTYPTYWTGLASPDPVSGLSTTIVGFGTEDGIPYIDVRFFGNTSASHPGYTSSILFEQNNWVTPVGQHQPWTFTHYARRMAGSGTNLYGLNNGYIFLDEAGAEIQRTHYFENIPTTAPLRDQRNYVNEDIWWYETRTIVPYWRLDFPSTNTVLAVDVTIRIGGPQLEFGYQGSGLILPPVGAPDISSRALEIYERVRAVARPLTTAGLGNVAVDATVQAPTGVVQTASVSIAGQGGVQAFARQGQVAQAAIGGIGTIAASASPLRPAAVTIAGVGAISVSAVQAMRAAGSIAGLGGVSASALRSSYGTIAIGGVGSVAASAQRVVYAASGVAGQGNVTVTVAARLPAAVTIAGVGNVSGASEAPGVAAARIDGVGSFSASAQRVVYAASAIAGIGNVAVAAVARLTASASIAGLGNVSGASEAPGVASSRIDGLGNVSIAAQRVVYAAVRIDGLGNVAANVAQRQFASVGIAGLGNVVAFSEAPGVGSSRINGLGAVAVSAQRLAYAPVTIAGLGAIAVDAGRITYGTVAIAGVGTIGVGSARQQTATTSVAGFGTISASVTQVHTASIAIAGLGGVRIELEGAAAYSRTDGTGTVAVSAAQRMVSAASSAGTGSVAVNALRLVPAATSIAGLASVSLSAARLLPAGVAVAGVGSFGASATRLQYAQIGIAGVGAFSAAAALRLPAKISIAGVGLVTVDAFTAGRQEAASGMSAAGAVSVSVTQRHVAKVTIAGLGTVSSAVPGQANTAVTIAGQGNVAVAATPGKSEALAIAGQGSVSVRADVQHAAACAIDGRGNLDLTVRQLCAAVSAIAGRGQVDIDVAAQLFSGARIDGLGLPGVDGVGLLLGSISIDGDGLVDLDVIGHLLADTEIDGEGHVSAAARLRQQRAAQARVLVMA